MARKTGQVANDANNRFMHYLTFISSLGGFLFGYDTGKLLFPVLFILHVLLFLFFHVFIIQYFFMFY